jgi:hypothetical protein
MRRSDLLTDRELAERLMLDMTNVMSELMRLRERVKKLEVAAVPVIAVRPSAAEMEMLRVRGQLSRAIGLAESLSTEAPDLAAREVAGEIVELLGSVRGALFEHDPVAGTVRPRWMHP